MNRKGYSFYYSDDQKMILSDNKDLVIEYSFTKNTYSEYLHNKKIATANQYFSSNGQLQKSIMLLENCCLKLTGEKNSDTTKPR